MVDYETESEIYEEPESRDGPFSPNDKETHHFGRDVTNDDWKDIL